MSHRLYLTDRQLEGATEGAEIPLESEQTHYLTRVLRLKAGARLHCFDGRGREWEASLEQVGRVAALTLGALNRQEGPPAHRLVLAVAWLKGAAMDTVVQKATELDATDILVLTTSRGNVQVDGRRTENKLRHWRQVAISAAEQSGRVHVPDVLGPLGLAAALELFPGCAFVLLDPGAAVLDVSGAPEDLMLLVGPEGGWTDEERALAGRLGARVRGLGRTVLRAETAPLAALAAVHQAWGWGR